MKSVFLRAPIVLGAAFVLVWALQLHWEDAASPGDETEIGQSLLQTAAAAQTDAPGDATTTEAIDNNPFGDYRASGSSSPNEDPFGPFGEAKAAFTESTKSENPFGTPTVVQPREGFRLLDIAGGEFASSGNLLAAQATTGDEEASKSAEDGEQADNSSNLSGVVKLRSASPQEHRIEAALRSPVKAPIEALQEPLTDLINQISVDYDLSIIFDTAELDAALISPDSEISLSSLGDISLRSALQLMLKQVGLAYIVENDVLLITTRNVAESKLTTHVYGVRGIGLDADEIAQGLPRVVAPGTWRVDKRGPGDVVAYGDVAIAVVQTQSVHEEVVEFLEQLYRLNERYGELQSPGFESRGFGRGGSGRGGRGFGGGGGGFF